MGSRAVRLAAFAAAAAVLGLWQVALASAAVGDIRRDIPAGSPGGVSVAFDGKNLYYTDKNGVVLHSVSPTGGARPDVPIVGAAGINALTYDATHDFFWAVDSTGLVVYQLGRDGVAMPQFALVPAVDLPGLCDVVTGCSTVVSGLAYDATTDSLWYAPQGTQRIYHLTTAGQLIGWFDTNETSGSLYPDCLSNGVSGLAAGANSLYVTAGDCAKGFRYAKSDSLSATKLGTFAAPAGAGDVECDNLTFAAATVVWVRSVADGHLRAVEVTSGTCVFGGGVALNKSNRWMSGAGEAFDVDDPTVSVPHAFHLLCEPGAQPNNMAINWKKNGMHFSFHLKRVDEVMCLFDGSGAPDPPPCDPTEVVECFNKILGNGRGLLVIRGSAGQIVFGQNCNDECGRVDFAFTDRGEPNRMDITQVERDEGELFVAEVTQDPVTGEDIFSTVLAACGCLRANYQAHQPGQ